LFHLVFLISLCNYYMPILLFSTRQICVRNPSLHYGLSAAAFFCIRNRTGFLRRLAAKKALSSMFLFITIFQSILTR
jgi:hypothetical protein